MENQGLSLEGIGFLVQLPLKVLAEPLLLKPFSVEERMCACIPVCHCTCGSQRTTWGSFSLLRGSLGLNSGHLHILLSIESFHRLVFKTGLLPGLDSPISYVG